MLATLISALHSARGIVHKRDIASVMQQLSSTAMLPQRFGGAEVRNGDDCAAIPDSHSINGGWLLLAIEGLLNEFVAVEPWFAGYCGVMVNVSDIYAMGGRPLAVVDALWSNGNVRAQDILAGMHAAAKVYGVPVVGGHSNAHCDREQLSVAILGRASQLLTSFDAKPGDTLLAAIDLRGRYREHFSNWDASSGSDPMRLRGDLEVLPKLAEDGLCRAAKDISQAGILGTLLMLMECSGIGASIDINAIPCPAELEVDNHPDALNRWLLQTFPSYGFLLAVAPNDKAKVLASFHARGLACAQIGECDGSRQLQLRSVDEHGIAWDFASENLIGCGPSSVQVRSTSLLEPATSEILHA
jgi:AIR synthase-related protein